MKGRRLVPALGIAGLIGLFFLSAKMLWLDGFDSGAAAMQCVDGYAQLGKEYMESQTCKEAFDRAHSVTWKLFSNH